MAVLCAHASYSLVYVLRRCLDACVLVQDKDFGRSHLHRSHFNPNAQVWTSLHVYGHYSIERAYIGETFFWATAPSTDDVIVMSFDPPILIEK